MSYPPTEASGNANICIYTYDFTIIVLCFSPLLLYNRPVQKLDLVYYTHELVHGEKSQHESDVNFNSREGGKVIQEKS